VTPYNVGDVGPCHVTSVVMSACVVISYHAHPQPCGECWSDTWQAVCYSWWPSSTVKAQKVSMCCWTY